MQDCGGCRWFLKLKNFDGNSGLCQFKDARTDEDCGHNCKEFKPPKHERKRFDFQREQDA